MVLLNELKKERDDLQKKLDAINLLIESYEGKSTTIDRPKSTRKQIVGFPEKGSYMEKVIFIIKDANRFLHNNEIAEALSHHDSRDVSELKRKVSAILFQAKARVETLTSVKHGKSAQFTFWGSTEWLDTNGKVKKEYMYDLDAIGGEPKKITL
jgi:hypothetical protein